MVDHFLFASSPLRASEGRCCDDAWWRHRCSSNENASWCKHCLGIVYIAMKMWIDVLFVIERGLFLTTIFFSVHAQLRQARWCRTSYVAMSDIVRWCRTLYAVMSYVIRGDAGRLTRVSYDRGFVPNDANIFEVIHVRLVWLHVWQTSVNRPLFSVHLF